MTASKPAPFCERCIGKGYLWTRLPDGNWTPAGTCPECKGSGKPPEPKEKAKP